MYHLQTMGRLAIKERPDSSESLMADQKPLLLVAYLALTPGHRAQRDHIAELFWPGNGHSTARRSLRQALYTVSKKLDAPLIESDNGDLWLSDNVSSCDAWELDAAIAAADHPRVVELSSRRFLETMARGLGHEVQEWIDLHNQRLRGTRLEALRSLIDGSARDGRFDEAQWYARAWVEDEPLDEEPRSALIKVLKAGGDEAAAYQAYEEYRTLLRSAVDDVPSRELEASVEQVRSILLEDDEWRPISDTAELLLTRRDAKKYATVLAAGVLIGSGVIVAAVMSITSGQDASAGAEAVGPRFGGGEIVVESAGTFQTIRYDDAAEEWQTGSPTWTPPEPTSNRPPQGPFRLLSGEISWTNAVREPEDPPFPVIHSEEGWLPIQITPGDNGWAIPSPDGRRFLVSSQRPNTTPFVKDLYIVSRDYVEGRDGADEPRRILEGTEQLGIYAWAPDGLAVATIARGAVDRVVILRPSGELVAEHSFYEISTLDWCGSSSRLAVLVNDRRTTQAVVIEVPSGEPRVVASNALAEMLACSPDGDGVAYLAAVDLEARLHLASTSDGTVEVLPSPEGFTTMSRIRWMPDGLRQAATDLSILGNDGTVAWGEAASLSATMSGSPVEHANEIRWTSSDPSVVSVSPGGTIHANRRGTARIVASLYDWVADTLIVTVEGERPPSLALEDPFTTLDETIWELGGTPTPIIRPAADGPALWLRGDGRYSDGIGSRQAFSIADGARLDFEFSFSPTRPTDESLQVCFREIPAGSGPFDGSIQSACMVYPARPLEKFDPTEVRLMSAPGVNADVHIPDDLLGTWIRASLEIRPDGTPALWINGQRMAEGAVRLQNRSRGDWHLTIVGDSTDPPLLVRGVSVWIGPSG